MTATAAASAKPAALRARIMKKDVTARFVRVIGDENSVMLRITTIKPAEACDALDVDAETLDVKIDRPLEVGRYEAKGAKAKANIVYQVDDSQRVSWGDWTGSFEITALDEKAETAKGRLDVTVDGDKGFAKGVFEAEYCP